MTITKLPPFPPPKKTAEAVLAAWSTTTSTYGSIVPPALQTDEDEVFPVAHGVEVIDDQPLLHLSPSAPSEEDVIKNDMRIKDKNNIGRENHNEDDSTLCFMIGVLAFLAGFVVVGTLFMMTHPSATPLPTSQTTTVSSLQSSEKVIAMLDMPRPTGTPEPLLDLIHVIDNDSAIRITSEIRDVEQDVPGSEIIVLIVNNIQPIIQGEDLTTKEFATLLFNRWGIGSAETNNGILILFMLDIRRIEIEVGQSLDPYMTNSWTTSMLQRRAVPEFKQGNYGFGIYNVVISLSDKLRDIQHGVAMPDHSGQPPPPPPPPSIPANDNGGGMASSNDHSTDDGDGSIAYIIVSIVAAMLCCCGCGCWYDNKYPMGMHYTCKNCSRNDANMNAGDKWKHQRWDYICEPTYTSEGLKRRYCVCMNCNYVDSKEQTIPRLTESSNEDGDNSASSRSGGGGGSGSGGGGGGGGHSSGGGGGGASW